MDRGIVTLVSFGVAFVLSWLVQPHFRSLGFLTDIVDHPGDRRSHCEPVPRTGGMAIFISFFCALFILESFVIGMALPWPWLMILIGAGMVILALGVGDDRFGIHAENKLYGQLIIVLGMMLFGQRFDAITLPLVGSIGLGGWAWPFTMLWYLGFINSMNLIDGLDGLASGISVLTALFLAILALAAGEVTSALLATTLAGCTMAFLYWNISNRKIFLGDSGSMWMGLVLATLMLNLSRSTAITVPVLLAPMIVPIWDTATTILRRFRQRVSIFQADDNHLHHRLVRLGFSPARAVVTLLLATGGASLFALSDALKLAWLGLPAMASWMVAMQLGALQHLNNRRVGWDIFSELLYALGLQDRVFSRGSQPERRVADIIDLQAAYDPLRRTVIATGQQKTNASLDGSTAAESADEGTDSDAVFPASRDL